MCDTRVHFQRVIFPLLLCVIGVASSTEKAHLNLATTEIVLPKSIQRSAVQQMSAF